MDVTKNRQGGETAPALGAETEEAAAAQRATDRAGSGGSPGPQIGDAIILEVPPYNPKLDPESPEFDIDLWKSQIDTDALRERMQESFSKISDSIQGLIDSNGYMSMVTDALRQTMGSAIEDQTFYTTAVLDAVKNLQPRELLADAGGSLSFLQPDFIQRLKESVANLIVTQPPEQLIAILEELKDDQEPEEDENQTSLFDEEEPAQKKKRKKKPQISKEAALIFAENVVDGALTILQNNTTNQLTKFSSRDEMEIDRITGTATIKRGDFILTFPEYLSFKGGLKTSTWQLLDALFLRLTADPRKSITTVITLSDYMQRRGLKDRKAAKEQVIADMKLLSSARITLEERKGKSGITYRFVNLAQSGSVEKNGDIVIKWTEDIHRDLINAPVMAYPRQLQEVNPHKFPNAYYMGRKAAELKNMNALHPNAGDIISVKTLLENAPFIPSYEEVAATNRHFTDRIIEPFERDLTALSGAFTWEYCHENGKPLTGEELEKFDYDTFISCNVRFTWTDYPDQTKRREKMEAEIERAQATAKKRKPGRPKKKPE